MLQNNFKTKSPNFNVIEFFDEELNVLNSLNDSYKSYSEMLDQDRAFLNSLILQNKPKKILEIGVAKGGSSIVILNAIKNIQDAHLYSLDYNKDCYRVKDKPTGFYVNNYPELKKNYTLKCGGLALNFMDEIGNDIDFCLIDTVHQNPGEILDFLMVLPYLSNNAIVVFHDTNLHLSYTVEGCYQYTNSLLISAISGDKLIPSSMPFESSFGICFPNISAVRLNDSSFKNLYEIFNLLTIKWTYMLSDEELIQIKNHFKRFYDEYYCQYFEQISNYQKNRQNMLKLYTKNNLTLAQRIFSITYTKNMYTYTQHKVISILGIRIKIKVKQKD